MRIWELWNCVYNPGTHLPTWPQAFPHAGAVLSKRRTFPTGTTPPALCGPDFRLTAVRTGGKILAMGQAKRPTCPIAGLICFWRYLPAARDSASPSALIAMALIPENRTTYGLAQKRATAAEVGPPTFVRFKYAKLCSSRLKDVSGIY